MNEQTVKEVMQQALDFLQAFAPRAHRMGKSSHANAVNRLVQAIADYEQAETQEPVRRLSDDEIGMVVDEFIDCTESVHVDDLVPMINAIMDACGIKEGKL
jgi:hypothetical protein